MTTELLKEIEKVGDGFNTGFLSEWERGDAYRTIALKAIALLGQGPKWKYPTWWDWKRQTGGLACERDFNEARERV